MAFASLDDLLAGMAAGGYRVPVSRASIATQVVGHEASLWRGTGFPAQGAIPGAAAICSDATVGAFPLAARSGGQERIVSMLALQGGTAGHTFTVEDRLGHMGGLVGNGATAQTVNLDIHTNIGVSNLAARVGNANYSEIEWYLEWYTATGATIATPTAAVTFNDGSTGTVNIWVLGATALPASVAASRRYKLVPANGLYIRSVQSVTLSVSTGTAGNFGVTAVRKIATFEATVANVLQARDWSQIASPKVADNACLTLSQVCNATSTGALTGALSQAVA